MLIYKVLPPPPQSEVTGLAVTIHHRQNTVCNPMSRRNHIDNYKKSKLQKYLKMCKNTFFINMNIDC